MKPQQLLLTITALVCVTFSVVAQPIQITPLDNNTSLDDFAPAVSNHGRMIVTTVDDDGNQRLHVMQRTSDGWTSTSTIPGDVNDGEQVGTATLTPDGQMMIFAAYSHDVDGFGRTDLYSATKQGSSWGDVKNLGGTVNSDAYDSNPTLSADGRTLYFVSDRRGSKGGTDIFMTQWNGKEWSAAIPLEGVNTPSDEMSPVIAADGTTLTFSSNRPGGKGGFDIYVAKVKGSTATGVQAASAPINTEADEMFYTSIPNSNQAYFSRTTERGDFDNFMAVPNPFPSDPVTLVEGTVRDAVTKQPLGADITVTDLTTQKTVSTFRSDATTGGYFVTLTPGRVYSITAKKKGYLFHSERYEVPPDAKGSTITKDIDLSPINGGGDRLLVFFDYDKSELKSESIPELERIIEFLRDNPNVSVSFEGHTDDQGADDYNMRLSEKRAQAVREYVITGGVDSQRVLAKGFGKTKPLVKGTTDDARAMNRRVEMRVK